jgi:hypothetical protein
MPRSRSRESRRECQAVVETLERRSLLASLTVNATDNIFGAGSTSNPTPEPAGFGGGTPAEVHALSPGVGRLLTINAVSGTVSLTPGYPSDGSGNHTFSTAIIAYGGISGVSEARSGFLVGVFLSDSDPSSAMPPASGLDQPSDLTPAAPQLGQLFYIGDGKSVAGTPENYQVPAGATRLYLGFADAFNYRGAPGAYGDNSGSLERLLANLHPVR